MGAVSTNECNMNFDSESEALFSQSFAFPTESQTTVELLEALVQASAEFKPVKPSKISKIPYPYKYATLDDMKAATEEALCKHSLRIVHQEIPLLDGKWMLVTTLRHVSGQWMASYAPVDIDPAAEKGFSSMQGWGKELTYTKKYQMGLLLNLSPEEDTDREDDTSKQEAASGAGMEKRKQTPAEKKTWGILNELGIDQAAWKQDMYAKYKIKSLTQFDATTWGKIAKGLENYLDFLTKITLHWECEMKDLRQFLIYKFGHKIAEAYDVLHEALNSENGKMAQLNEEFRVWKGLPDDDPEAASSDDADFFGDDVPEGQVRPHNPPK